MTVAAVSALSAYDQLMLTAPTTFLSQRNPELDVSRCELIATTVLKASNELLWLAFTRDEPDRRQLVAKTKPLITAYLQTYRI